MNNQSKNIEIKMIITYVYHSCCAIEFDAFSVIIDYYKDALVNENGKEEGWIADYLLKKEKPLYVLCTHSHSDHFNPDVLTWNKSKTNVTYLFSKEVKDTLKGILNDDKVHYLDKLESFEDDNLSVKAFGSTDAGASFYIQHNDVKIFHAGDLNNWHWNEEVPKDESFVFENQYICELELVAEEVKQLDIAMFPLDPRLGKDFLRGGEQFINKIKTANLLPLHFGDNYQLIKQFKPIAEAANCKLLPLEHTGQSFKIK